MVDFYLWEYEYGHNLDPTAPIQVPGMSYQPPLIGYKMLLNFGAYYRVHDRVELSLNAYNTLGWIDKDYNKRNFLAFSGGGYLTEAPALAASLKVNF